jgi:small-conductance mechanosensitive channel
MDLTITWLERSVMQLESGSRNLVGIDQEQMRDWRASIDSVRKQLTEKQQLLQGKSSSIEAMIARAQAAERVIAARAGSSIADSVTFASNLQP